MSRTVPWPPTNRPSSKTPTALTSVGTRVPSLRRMTNRSRSGPLAGSWRSVHARVAASIDSSATMNEKCSPVISTEV
jgi:predicted N-formylglutamate amidohydrolase